MVGAEDTAPEPRCSGRDLALALVVPLVALAVAGVAIVRFHTVDQSSWQGVGFGMFATHEYAPSRTIRVEAVVDGRRERVPVPADLDHLAERVLVAPGDPEAVELARRMRSRLAADAVTLTVLRHDVAIERDGLQVGLAVVREVQVP